VRNPKVTLRESGGKIFGRHCSIICSIKSLSEKFQLITRSTRWLARYRVRSSRASDGLNDFRKWLSAGTAL